jgi:hypothetical protein
MFFLIPCNFEPGFFCSNAIRCSFVLLLILLLSLTVIDMVFVIRFLFVLYLYCYIFLLSINDTDVHSVGVFYFIINYVFFFTSSGRLCGDVPVEFCINPVTF